VRSFSPSSFADGFEAKPLAVSLLMTVVSVPAPLQFALQSLEQWIVFGWQVPILAAPDLDFADHPHAFKMGSRQSGLPLPWPSCGSLTAMRGDSPVGWRKITLTNCAWNNCWI